MLGNAEGVFDLSDSDRRVGSFISKKDLLLILGLPEEILIGLASRIIDGETVYDERTIHHFWYGNDPLGFGKGMSFDELILHRLVKRTFPDAVITRQEPVKRFKMDLAIEVNGIKKFIEFDGPSHFSAGRYGPPKQDLFSKKKIVEDLTGYEVVNWPYWVQRCEANVRAAIKGYGPGYGVLWSTNCHFGDFAFENSASIIVAMSMRFGIPDSDGFGHFYGPNTLGRNNPEHPIIQRILNGKEDVGRLIPKGAKDRNFWLPEKLRAHA